jgi:hypothetical protein
LIACLKPLRLKDNGLTGKVSDYWIISPEDQSLIAYKFVGEKYSLIETIEHCEGSVRIEPFTDLDFDLSYVFEN